ncbi:flagellar basal body P-ring formation chaperone FlgA [Burkholderia stagnalis]|uniref:flagellar basal body P-ring formation chaperone FlgA n=1 Tax=Burkholderia stagnalis TaxID=1503054 RepID=UPI00075F4277|nr:flagellar biosynthesis protein FlgA [Burkholderia stagnalis]KVN23985.1 flagellar biosynthesis protein FlgA [Burkholderia stagnalis]KVN36972.1 flagellar biosynthesis protein FlgA [Burkholderia stagnalis]KWI66720.1 flagellar biosynthesis protein FlgA [Burkholderia stagnalis]KWK73835.1 flagellar biosynthesis protein FlgA [Burkholderia stagnalis]
MTGSALRSDNGRRPRMRRAFALAAALWLGAAHAADDGMIVIPGRGETAETALAAAGAASAGRTAGPAQAGMAPEMAQAVRATGVGAQPAGVVTVAPGINAANATNAATIAAGQPAGAPAFEPRTVTVLPAAPAPAPAAPRIAAPPAGNPAPAYGAARSARPAMAAGDPGRIVTVVAGTAAQSGAPDPRTPLRPALAPRQPALRASPAVPAPATLPGQQDPEAIQRTALAFLQQQIAGLPGKTTATVSPSLPRGLAACTTLEPFLPTGARLWGRTTVGVRCAGERPWTVYLQAKVVVQATYYVAARQIAPGEPLTAADLVARDGDLTVLPQAVITDPSQAIGATALARVAAGLPLRQDMLKSAASVSAGQTVRVVAAGPGFTISAEGSALANAAPGQSVRVRLAAGQIVTAIVKDAGTVEIPL